MSTLEKGSLVLITGVSGYIASHTAVQFVEAGYRVRGTVRSEDKAAWLYELFDSKYGKGKFEAVVVPDMKADNAFDEAIRNVDGVCHMASVMSFSDKPDEVIPVVVKGATNIINAAIKESSIKALVYTSSSTAALMPQPDKVIKVSEDTWDNEAVEIANGPNPDSWNIYGASKTGRFGKTVKDLKPSFQVATVLPNANLGPIIKPGGEDTSSTSSWVLKLFKGDAKAFDDFPPQYYVDVRDTARLHVIALTDPSCNGRRLFAFAAPFNRTDALNVFRGLFPKREFPADTKVGKDLSEIPNGEAERLLRKHYNKGFSSLEDVLAALTAGFD